MSQLLFSNRVSILNSTDVLIASGTIPLKFVGSVLVSQILGKTVVNIGGGSSIEIRESGTVKLSTGVLNFIGASVVANAGVADITISAAMPPLPAAQLFVGDNLGVATARAITGDVSFSSLGVTTVGLKTLGGLEQSTGLAVKVDGASVLINGAGALYSVSTLPGLPSANLFVGNNLGIATAQAITGDVTISNTGVTTVGLKALGGLEQSTGLAVKVDGTSIMINGSGALYSSGGTVSGNPYSVAYFNNLGSLISDNSFVFKGWNLCINKQWATNANNIENNLKIKDNFILGRNISLTSNFATGYSEYNIILGRSHTILIGMTSSDFNQNIMGGQSHTYTTASGKAVQDNLITGNNNTLCFAASSLLTSVICGTSNKINGAASFFGGTTNTSSGSSSIFSGSQNTSSCGNSIIYGLFNDSSGNHQLIGGNRNIVGGNHQIVSGIQNTIYGSANIVSGTGIVMPSNDIGGANVISGLGNLSTNSLGSIICGSNNIATNGGSIADTIDNNLIVGSSNSVSLLSNSMIGGMGNTYSSSGTAITSRCAFIFGKSHNISFPAPAADYMFAVIGRGLLPLQNNSTTLGRFNKSYLGTYVGLLTVGRGADDLNRSNAFMVDDNGDVHVGRKLRMRISPDAQYSPNGAASGITSLAAGTKTVLNNIIGPTDNIFITAQDVGTGTPGELSISNRVSGVSFDIVSTSPTDNRSVAWFIMGMAAV